VKCTDKAGWNLKWKYMRLFAAQFAAPLFYPLPLPSNRSEVASFSQQRTFRKRSRSGSSRGSSNQAAKNDPCSWDPYHTSQAKPMHQWLRKARTNGASMSWYFLWSCVWHLEMDSYLCHPSCVVCWLVYLFSSCWQKSMFP
jgi:hypothetical protein